MDDGKKGGRSGLAWLSGSGLGTGLGLLLSRLIEDYARNPLALVVIALFLLVVGLVVAFVAMWLTGQVVHIREYNLLAQRCSKVEARLDQMTNEAFVATRITGLAVQQRAEGGGSP